MPNPRVCPIYGTFPGKDTLFWEDGFTARDSGKWWENLLYLSLMTYEQMPDEWKEWIDLTPIERFRQSEILFAYIWQWEAALIPTPIRQVLSTMRVNGVRALLMGGARLRILRRGAS